MKHNAHKFISSYLKIIAKMMKLKLFLCCHIPYLGRIFTVSECFHAINIIIRLGFFIFIHLYSLFHRLKILNFDWSVNPNYSSNNN